MKTKNSVRFGMFADSVQGERLKRSMVALRSALHDEIRSQAIKKGHSISRVLGDAIADGIEAQKRTARKAEK